MSEDAKRLAERFEATHNSFKAFIQTLNDDEWLELVPNEERTVAAMTHHIAWAYAIEMESFAGMADGGNPRTYTSEDFAAFNAANGEEFAECEKEETLSLLEANAREAVAKLRAFTDEQLMRTGKYVQSRPELPVGDCIDRVLIGHIIGHERSIRDALEKTSK